MTRDDDLMADPLRTLRVIVQAERLVADLNEHTARLARFIEEERSRDRPGED